jgi:hypothetical protein
MELEEYIQKIIEFGKKEKALINPIILELVIKNEFKCICKLNIQCPCEEAPKELKKNGKCYCGLFVRK